MTDKKSTSTEIEDLDAAVKQIAINRQDDYEYAREILYASAEKLQDILETAVSLARESEHPRVIEVATNTATALSQVAAAMMEHHLRSEKLNNPKGESKQVTNNVNVKLNTKDLLELLSKE